MMTKRNTVIGISSIIGSTFLYGFFGILTRSIGYQIPLFYGSLTRLLFSFLILFAMLYWTKQLKTIKKQDLKWFILRSIAGNVGFVGSYVSFYVIPIGLAYFIFYGGSTIGGYIIGKVLFKEKLTRVKLTSLFIALLGLVFVYSSNIKLSLPIYMLAALISGFGTSVWNTFSKKISRDYSATQLNMSDNLFSLPIVLVVSLILKETWVLPSINLTWLFNFLFASMFIVTGQLIIYGFKHLEAQIASLFMLAEILFGILLGYLFYKEMISVFTIIGGLTIIVAIILPELNWKKISKKSP